MPQSLKSIRDQVIAGILIAGITWAAGHLAKTAPMWVQWALWVLLIIALALLMGVVARALLLSFRRLPSEELRAPMGTWQCLGQSDGEVFADPNGWLNAVRCVVGEVAQHVEVEVTLLLPPRDAGADPLYAGVDFFAADSLPVLTFAITSNGSVHLFEKERGSARLNRSGVAPAGVPHVLHLVRRDDGYVPSLDGVAIFGKRPLVEDGHHAWPSYTSLQLRAWAHSGRPVAFYTGLLVGGQET